MAADRTITIRIDQALLSSALRAARTEGMTAGEFVRAALCDRVHEVLDGGARDPVGVIRRALRGHFARATDWVDLQRRLRADRFVLRDFSGELWLYTWPVERRLVPLFRLGVSRNELTLIFKAPFPAHGGGVMPFPVEQAKAA